MIRCHWGKGTWMNKKVVLVLLICFLFSYPALSYHHHKDGVPHDTCVICSHILHCSSLISQDNPQISITVSETIFHLLSETLSGVYQCYPPYLTRAPPT
jgi:hypothetical protein